ncbi:MAG: hypothetical protein QI197_04565 [Candidatus Korarchaeota archaeon]|nr:hypothetical protein [Candidatus Korarchaeota archaeon]
MVVWTSSPLEDVVYLGSSVVSVVDFLSASVLVEVGSGRVIGVSSLPCLVGCAIFPEVGGPC